MSFADAFSSQSIPRRSPNSISAWDLLNRPLKRCPIAKHTPSQRSGNSTAIAARYNKAIITYKDWNDVFPSALQQAHDRNIRFSGIEVPYSAQHRRVLDTEGDVGDTMLLNVIQPVISVLNKLIHPELRRDLVIVPGNQRGTSFKFQKQMRDSSYRMFTSNIALDHSLILIDKRAFDLNWEPQSSEVLVVFEEKRIPFVDPSQWTRTAFKSESPNSMNRHLPQILMYAEQYSCNHFLLTDSERSVCIHASASTRESDNMHATPAEIDAEVAFCGDKRTTDGQTDSSNPFFSGLSNSLCALGIDALRNLGILDDQRIPLSQETRLFPPRHASHRVLKLLKGGQEQIVEKHKDFALFDCSPEEWLANSNKPDRVEIRRQREAGEPVPHALPKGWRFV